MDTGQTNKDEQYSDPEFNHFVRTLKTWAKRTARKASLADWLMVTFNFCLAVTAICQIVLIIQNSSISTAQIDRLFDAANRLEDAADSFSGSASHINQGMRGAVRSLETANNENRERFRQDSRPYVATAKPSEEKGSITLVSEGPRSGQIMFKFDIENSGKTPAVWVDDSFHIAIGKEEILNIPITASRPSFRHTVIPAGSTATVYAYSRIIAPGIKNGETYHLSMQAVYGVLHYTDIFPKSPIYETRFCAPIKGGSGVLQTEEEDRIYQTCTDYNRIK